MTYRKKITRYFIVFSIAMTFLYSQILIGASFIFQDWFHESLLEMAAENYAMVDKQASSGDGTVSPVLDSGVLVIEEFSPAEVPEHYARLSMGLTELNDEHVLRQSLANGNQLFVSAPEFRDLTADLLPLLYFWLIGATLFVCLLGVLSSIVL